MCTWKNQRVRRESWPHSGTIIWRRGHSEYFSSSWLDTENSEIPQHLTLSRRSCWLTISCGYQKPQDLWEAPWTTGNIWPWGWITQTNRNKPRRQLSCKKITFEYPIKKGHSLPSLFCSISGFRRWVTTFNRRGLEGQKKSAEWIKCNPSNWLFPQCLMKKDFS